MISLTSDFGSITINRLLDQSSWWTSAMTNTLSKSFDSGYHIGYSVGKKFIRGELLIRLVSESEVIAFESFILQARFGKTPLSITVSDGGEVGGLTSLSLCYWNGENNTENYIIPLARKTKFDIVIPYVTFNASTISGFGARR